MKVATNEVLAKISRAENSILRSKHGSVRLSIQKKQEELGCDATTAKRWLMCDVAADLIQYSMTLDLPVGEDVDDINSQRVVE